MTVTVQIRSDKQALRFELPASGELNIEDSVALARDLIDAVTQCGHEVKMDVSVPRHQPTDQEVATAIHRVAHLRKTFDSTPWNDTKANTELVMRVINACL
jgi:hypothetical protein